MKSYQRGTMVKAVDSERIRAKCEVKESRKECVVVVSFVGWSSEWDRTITNPHEIQKPTEEVLQPRNLSHKKVSNKSYMLDIG